MRHQPGLFKKLLMMGVTALALASEALSEAPQLFQLRLLHMNDLHSRFQQVTSRYDHYHQPEGYFALPYSNFIKGGEEGPVRLLVFET